jgi:cell division protein FtsB
MSIHTSSLTSPRFGTITGTHTVIRRLVWNVVPVLMVLAAVQMALLGDDGLLKRHQVKQRLYSTQVHVDTVKVYNERLRARIRMLRTDPRYVKRAVAEKLLLAEAGSTIYRFEGPIRSR